MFGLALALTLNTPLAVVQEGGARGPQEDPRLTRAWERWDQFDDADHREMAASIESYVFDAEHPKLRILAALQTAKSGPKTLRSRDLPAFDAKEYAPALKLRTKNVTRKKSSWKRFAKKYGIDPEWLPEQHWAWSSGRQALLAPEDRVLSSRARIEAMLRGEFPEPKYWLARLEAELDFDPLIQEAAAYFEHNYRDRDGNLYEGIRLADLWASQREFGISDVEAIAFLRNLLEDDSIRSPIPSRLHRGIYALIREQYEEVREAEQLRLALAGSYLGVEKAVPIVLRSVIPRLDLAWAVVGDDPARMRAWLKEHPTRMAFLGSIEKRIATHLTAHEVSEQELATRSGSLAAHLAVRALEGMKREGLMGLRGR
ncbi:MAG: hypothetical protein MK209_03560 [Planctomycetes bacterium]|nr:hypothetical protein [Planctomycetota bacterium]